MIKSGCEHSSVGFQYGCQRILNSQFAANIVLPWKKYNVRWDVRKWNVNCSLIFGFSSLLDNPVIMDGGEHMADSY